MTPQQVSKLAAVVGSLAGCRGFLEIQTPNESQRRRIVEALDENQGTLERLIYDVMGENAIEYIGPLAVERFREGG